MVLHRPLGNEQCLRDLPVRLSLGRQLRDPELAGGERVAPADGRAPRPAAGDHQFLACQVREPDPARRVSQVECFVENLARPRPGACPAMGGAEVNLRGANTSSGISRTLVLLDGRRTTPNSRFGAVDISSFPDDLIKEFMW